MKIIEGYDAIGETRRVRDTKHAQYANNIDALFERLAWVSDDYEKNWAHVTLKQ